MKSFCIIGLGCFGQMLADTLIRNQHQVMVIDSNAERAALYAERCTDVIIGDATSEDVLRASGVSNYDCAVVCLSENANDSILTTLLLKDLGMRRIVARANSELHRRVLEKVGADSVVFPERDMGEKLAYLLERSNVMEYIEFSEDYSIVEIRVPSSWIGHSLIDTNVRRKYDINIIAVTSEDGHPDITPRPERVFSKGDQITLIGKNETIDKLMKIG